MGRIRTIKPEFPQSESMGRVSRDARLLFIQLWTLADDSGRLRGNSRMLASLLFPYDDDVPELIDGWFAELEKNDCAIRYQIGGNSYIQICKWLIHQKIDKPSPSKIPGFVESSRILANVRGGIKDQGPMDQGPMDQGPMDQGPMDQGPMDQGPMEGIKDQTGITIVEQKPLDQIIFAGMIADLPTTALTSPTKTYPQKIDPVQQIFECWQKIMGSPKSVLDGTRRGLITKALKGYSPADICQAIRGCSKSPHNMGKNDRNTKYNGLNLILRDADRIDYFINLDGAAATSAVETITQRNERIMAEVCGTAVDLNDLNTIDMEAA